MEIKMYMITIIKTELVTINIQTINKLMVIESSFFVVPKGENGSRIFLDLGEGVLIKIVRYSTPKLELNDTTLILSWVMENIPAPILTSCR